MPLSALAVCEHQASISEAESTFPRLAVVLHSDVQERGLPVQMLQEKTKSGDVTTIKVFNIGWGLELGPSHCKKLTNPWLPVSNSVQSFC